ncbi:Membrane domain of glycerophosphoryl diester phosphodiesterase [Sinosporangium album]|uniref:Membrane domain of glycerophosphoryl diester phosphodiesterase n=1 Tax=Sinosporangium album TaxID=504805 RepID=A0A1G7VWY0_9ACTN|nr:glycerophosphoryl diester phosphodiesterase membrane domain-containing protein [Sinosporangium album]SDG64282.1 Membrane domain of glycerophosphoryl diester phosphodiesterase [Sinosporangium album]
MSDGHGSNPEPPPAWAPQQPPPYDAERASPWTTPGSPQSSGPQGQVPPPQQHPGQPYGSPQHGQPPYGGNPYGAYGQAPYGQAPYGQHPGYGQAPPALRPGIIPLRPLGLGDILDGATKLIRSNPGVMLGLSAIFAAAASIPTALSQAGQLETLNAPIPQTSEAAVDEMLGSLTGLGVSLLVSFVVVTVLGGIVTRVLGRAVFGGRITMGEAWNLTKGRLPALFGLAVLTTLVITVVPLLLIFLIMAAVWSGVVDPMTALGLLMLSIAIILPYALFFQTKFALAAPAVVLEGRSAPDAIRRSWSLTSGSFWRILGITLLTTILVFLFNTLVSLPFGMIVGLIALTGGASSATLIIATLVSAIGSTIAATVAYPFQAGVMGLLYADRRMRAEAFDLVLQTAAIEQQRQGWVHASADDLWHPSNSAHNSAQRTPPGAP